MLIKCAEAERFRSTRSSGPLSVLAATVRGAVGLLGTGRTAPLPTRQGSTGEPSARLGMPKTDAAQFCRQQTLKQLASWFLSCCFSVQIKPPAGNCRASRRRAAPLHPSRKSAFRHFIHALVPARILDLRWKRAHAKPMVTQIVTRNNFGLTNLDAML